MKILFLINGLGVGGAETQVLALAPQLIRRGHDVILISMIPDLRLLDRLAQNVTHVNLNISSWRQLIKGTRQLFAIIKDFKPDIIHANLFQANLLSRVIKIRFPRLKIINTSHCNYGQLGAKRYDYYRIYQLTKHWVDFHSAVSQQALNELIERKCISSKKANVIYNGLDSHKYLVERKALTKGQTFKWIAIGRIIPLKNYSLLIKVAKRLKREEYDFCIDIAGEGPERSNLEQMIVSKNLTQNIRFLGYQSEIPKLLAEYNGYVICSNTEGLPMALLEAMASNLVIVASKVGEIPVIFQKLDSASLFTAGDEEGLYLSIKKAMELTEKEREEQTQQNQKFINNTFHIIEITKKWEAVYGQILNKN